MEQKISEIKQALQAADISGLPCFIKAYEADERAGVVSLVKKARKILNDYEKEIERTEQMKAYEKEYASFAYICGIDEVGRGPLIGPVVAAAVILPIDFKLEGLTDSKKLSEKKREQFYKIIEDVVLSNNNQSFVIMLKDKLPLLKNTYNTLNLTKPILKK